MKINLSQLNLCLRKNNFEYFMYYLGSAARRFGLTNISKRSGLSHQTLADAFNGNHTKLRISTVIRILNAMDIILLIDHASSTTQNPNIDLFEEDFIECSFKEKYPHLAKMWDSKKNGPMINVDENNLKLAFWLCENNHGFKKTIHSMVKNQECPFCEAIKLVKSLENNPR